MDRRPSPSRGAFAALVLTTIVALGALAWTSTSGDASVASAPSDGTGGTITGTAPPSTAPEGTAPPGTVGATDLNDADAVSSTTVPDTTAQPGTTVAPEPPPAGHLGSGAAVVFAFGGDTHFEGQLHTRLLADPAGVLAPIAPLLTRADVAVVNLETAIGQGGQPAPKQYVFLAPPVALDALAAAGVDTVSLANNHGMDHGMAGLEQTLAAERASGFPLIGIGADDVEAYAPYRTEVRGQRIAVIAATQVLDDEMITAWTAGAGKPGLASAKQQAALVSAVEKARLDSDTLVVFVHWGIEDHTCPSGNQVALADALVAAGADIVVGSHAHRLQGAGRSGDAFVAYGLGNFVWYNESGASGDSGVLEVTATGRRIDGYQWHPARIAGGVPRPSEGAARDQALAAWDALRDCTDLTP